MNRRGKNGGDLLECMRYIDSIAEVVLHYFSLRSKEEEGRGDMTMVFQILPLGCTHLMRRSRWRKITRGKTRETSLKLVSSWRLPECHLVMAGWTVDNNNNNNHKFLLIFVFNFIGEKKCEGTRILQWITIITNTIRFGLIHFIYLKFFFKNEKSSNSGKMFQLEHGVQSARPKPATCSLNSLIKTTIRRQIRKRIFFFTSLFSRQSFPLFF